MTTHAHTPAPSATATTASTTPHLVRSKGAVAVILILLGLIGGYFFFDDSPPDQTVDGNNTTQTTRKAPPGELSLGQSGTVIAPKGGWSKPITFSGTGMCLHWEPELSHYGQKYTAQSRLIRGTGPWRDHPDSAQMDLTEARFSGTNSDVSMKVDARKYGGC